MKNTKKFGSRKCGILISFLVIITLVLAAMVIACAGPEGPVGEAGENGQDANTDANRIWLSDPDADGIRWWMIGTTNSGIEADGKAQLFFVDEDDNEVVGPALADYIANEELNLYPIDRLMVRFDPRYSFEVCDAADMIIAWNNEVIAPPFDGVTATEGRKELKVYGPSAYPLSFFINVIVYEYTNAPVIASSSAAMHNYGEQLTATFTTTPADANRPGGIDPLIDDNFTWQWYKNGAIYGPAVKGASGKILTSAGQKGTYKVGVKSKGFSEKFSNEITDLRPWFSTVVKLRAYLVDTTWTTSAAAPESVRLNVLVGDGSVGPVGEDLTTAIEVANKYLNLDLSGSTAYNTLSSGFFEDCDLLVGINLGKNITSVEQRVFYKCDNLAAITVDSENPNLEMTGGALYSISPKELLYYMSKNTTDTLTIPAGVETILQYAVTFNDSLKNLEIRGSALEILNFAFWNLPNIEKVTFYPVVVNPNDNAVLRKNAMTWLGDLQEKIVAGGGKGIYVRTDSSSGNPASYVWKKESSLP